MEKPDEATAIGYIREGYPSVRSFCATATV
jgi:hypothetical protein